MTNAVTFKVLEDIARDLSGSEITFPTFLDITFQVRSALKDPNLSIDQLAKLVGAEPLMSAKIIRMANSVALNPSGREIADVKSAIVRVGMEAVRTVSFAVAMEQLLKSKQMQPFEGISQRLWEHTSHVAALCRVLARKLAKINGDEAMFTGLVHDLGVFYLMSRAANFPELVADKAELHALLVDWHDNIGHALLSALGSPERCSKPCATMKPIARSVRSPTCPTCFTSPTRSPTGLPAGATRSWMRWSIPRCSTRCSMPRRWPKSSRSRKRKCSH